MTLSPIVVFAYKRPEQLQRMLRSLAANEIAKSSALIIYCDGPKEDATEHDREGIAKVRSIAHAQEGFLSVKVIEAAQNKGLARSVIEGVTSAVTEYGNVIVVEDDAVLSPHFLAYMNNALTMYEKVDSVFSVGSWNYYATPEMVGETYFIRYPDSLAWATWQRSWSLFEQDGHRLMAQLKEKGRVDQLDADGRITYFSRMLKDQIQGKIDSWAIRWTATCILHGKMNLFPHRPLALNKGFGKDATHEKGATSIFDHLQLCASPVVIKRLNVHENMTALEARAAFIHWHFEGGSDPSLKGRIWRALPTGLKNYYLRIRKRADS